MQHLFKNWLKLIYLTLLLHKVLFYMIGKPNTLCLLDNHLIPDPDLLFYWSYATYESKQ